MEYLNLANLTLLTCLIIVKSVASEFVTIQKGDARNWIQYGTKANLVTFNNFYTIAVNEEMFHSGEMYSGRCDEFRPKHASLASSLSYPDQCPGTISHCWLQEESAARKAAYEEYNKITNMLIAIYMSPLQAFALYTSRVLLTQQQVAWDKYLHTGNVCGCHCERTYDPNPLNDRGELLDSICFDPVSVNSGYDDYVATGVRFKRHGNVIHLELQEGIQSDDRIINGTVRWTTSKYCVNKKKVLYNFRSGGYDRLKITLENLILPENAGVTGVTLGESLRGQYIDDYGNFYRVKKEIYKPTQCRSNTTLVNDNSSPSTTGESIEIGESCKHHILFGGSSEGSDRVQHVVPYVDLQEVVTNPPQRITGIGWYFRGNPGNGGFLALKVFTEKYFYRRRSVFPHFDRNGRLTIS